MNRASEFFATISAFFVSNRPLSYILLFTLLGLGIVSFIITPKQYNPEIVRPAFAISLTYDGATVEQATDRVVYELVEKIGVVPGVDDIYTTVRDGATIDTTVIFEVGHDITQAKVDLTTQIDQHSYRARGFIAEPSIQEINPETLPVLQVVFFDPERSVAELRSYVESLRRPLVDIPDVSEIEVVGGYEPAMVVAADPLRLQEAGVHIDNLRDALVASQRRMVTQGVQDDVFRRESVVDSPYTSALELATVPVGAGYTAGDVASIYKGSAGTRSYVYHASKEQQEEVVMLSVAKVEGANAPTVSEAVHETLAEVVSELGQDSLEYMVVADEGALAAREITGLAQNLLTSVVIVAAVLFLFLSARAALVVLITIPLTFLVVFFLGYLFEQTINRITLFALILSLGLLVDAAIVVTENIHTRLQQAVATTRRATVVSGAVGMVALGLLLSLVTSVIVFLPMRNITGMMGPYMGPIAFFVPAALIVSFVIAIVVTPFLASRILAQDGTTKKKQNFVQVGMDRARAFYRSLLGRVLRDRARQRRIIVGAFTGFVVSLLLPLLALVHFQMLPGADREQLYVYLDMPVDTSSEVTRQQSQQLRATLLDHPEVSSVQTFVGQPPIVDFNGMFKGAQERGQSWQATLRVNLTDLDARRIDSESITQELRQQVATKTELATHTRFLEEPPGPPVRATFEGRIYSENGSVRDELAVALYQTVTDIDGVTDPYVVTEDAVGRVVYTPDPAALREFGVSYSAVLDRIALLSDPQPIGEYMASEAGEYTPLLLSITPIVSSEQRATLDTMHVQNEAGTPIPLASLVSEQYESRPGKRTLESTGTFIGVTAETADRPIVYIVIDVINELRRNGLGEFVVSDWGLFGMTLVDSAGNTVAIEWGGEWEMTLENFRDLGIAMILAFVLVYGVLVARYRNFSTPALILVTVPLGLIGILWGFLVLDQVFGIYLTATALIGFIALIGIVVNNAIIYLEYVEYAMADGLSRVDALVEAGSHRLQPIMLTSLTTVLGSLTIAFDPVWSGLAWAIVFGLSVSTLLTLVIYPILLVYVQGDVPGRTDHSMN